MATSPARIRRPHRRRTQAERRELSEQRMLDAAFRLIERQGASRTTLVEIGELSGYSHGLVSHRFGSKRELVRAATQRLQARFLRLLEPALAERRGLKALLILADTYLRTGAASDRNAMYVLIGEALGPLPEIRSDMAAADLKFRTAVKTIVEDGIRIGEIRGDINPAAYAALFVGTLRGLMVQHLMDPKSFDIDSVCREMARNIESALSIGARRETRRRSGGHAG